MATARITALGFPGGDIRPAGAKITDDAAATTLKATAQAVDFSSGG